MLWKLLEGPGGWGEMGCLEAEISRGMMNFWMRLRWVYKCVECFVSFVATPFVLRKTNWINLAIFWIFEASCFVITEQIKSQSQWYK